MTETSMTFLSALMLLGGIQGLFLAALLLRLRKNNFSANRYLATILAALGLTLLHQYLVVTDYILQIPALIGTTMPLDLIYPSSLYLYVRSMTQPNLSASKDRLHYILPMFGIILLLPFYVLDFETKLAIVQNNYMISDWPGVMEYTFPLAMFVAAMLFTFYLILSFKLLFAHTQTIRDFFSYRNNITLSWLRNLLLLMLVFWLFMMVFYYIYYAATAELFWQSRQIFNWLFVFSIFVVFYIGTMGLLQRRIYRPNMLVPEQAIDLSKHEVDEDTTSKPKTDKYKNSALTTEMSERILKRLSEAMEKEKPYLKNNLTLPDLAKMVATSPNYLSQIINEQLEMNFFDYVNSYRIERAKKLIINPLPHTHTILDIAMESAFNSKSAFYTAFKKQMGITPVQYKKSLVIPDSSSRAL